MIARLVEFLEEGVESRPADVAVLVGEAVDRSLQTLEKYCIILTFHLKYFKSSTRYQNATVWQAKGLSCWG
jgi:hypothetical protein